MKRVFAFVAAVCTAAMLSPLSATAALFRAYLSSAGQPGNDCSLLHPCRYLTDAVAAVASGGEIWILDSANYNQGTVDINKSVTILAIPGQVGSIMAIGNAPAISITAPVDVTLRNVVISRNAISPGTHGISVNGANSVTIEDSILADLAGKPIYVTGSAHVRLKDSVIRNSTQESIFALNGPIVDVIRCKLIGSFYGGIGAQSAAGFTTLVNVTDSIISGHDTGQGVGVLAYADSGGTARVYLTRSTIFQTQRGVEAGGGGSAAVQVSASMVVRNHRNLNIYGSGAVYSLGNNHISDGESADIGALSALAPR